MRSHIGLYEKYQDATMLIESAFKANLQIVEQHVPAVEGCIIEAGTWRGGMSAALMETIGADRSYHFFDSFQGLPPAEEIDGEAAIAWQADAKADRYFNNCTATLSEFEATLDRVPANWDYVDVYAGWMPETLSHWFPEHVALLRIDVDWFKPTLVVLNHFWTFLAPGAVVILDDYYAWDGCARAVHKVLADRNAAERIQSLDGVAYVIKREQEPLPGQR
jgi:hypothetical protein